MNFPAVLKDVTVEGITHVTKEMIQAAKASNQVYKLVGNAIWNEQEKKYVLSVSLMLLPSDDFLATVSGWEMGVEIQRFAIFLN